MKNNIILILIFIYLSNCKYDNNGNNIYRKTITKRCDIDSLKLSLYNKILSSYEIQEIFNICESDTIVLNYDNQKFLFKYESKRINNKVIVYKKLSVNYHVDNLPDHYRNNNKLFIHENIIIGRDSIMAIFSLHFGTSIDYYFQIQNCNLIIIDSTTSDLK